MMDPQLLPQLPFLMGWHFIHQYDPDKIELVASATRKEFPYGEQTWKGKGEPMTRAPHSSFFFHLNFATSILSLAEIQAGPLCEEFLGCFELRRGTEFSSKKLGLPWRTLPYRLALRSCAAFGAFGAVPVSNLIDLG